MRYASEYFALIQVLKETKRKNAKLSTFSNIFAYPTNDH